MEEEEPKDYTIACIHVGIFKEWADIYKNKNKRRGECEYVNEQKQWTSCGVCV